MATRKTPTAKTASGRSSKISAARKAARPGTRSGRIPGQPKVDEALAEYVEPPLGKVQINSRIPGELASAVLSILRDRESMYDFVAVAVENEFHRRRRTKPVRDLTLADLDSRLVAVAAQIEALSSASRKTEALVESIAQELGV